jgi:hypothetical protein
MGVALVAEAEAGLFSSLRRTQSSLMATSSSLDLKVGWFPLETLAMEALGAVEL